MAKLDQLDNLFEDRLSLALGEDLSPVLDVRMQAAAVVGHEDVPVSAVAFDRHRPFGHDEFSANGRSYSTLLAWDSLEV